MLTIGCLVFPISLVSSFVASSLLSVSSVSHPFSISALFLFSENWFNVQLKLSKAINTVFVMTPAELQMELLILLSLLALLFSSIISFISPPSNIVPSFSSSGTVLVNSTFWTFPLCAPFVVYVLWVLCCSSNENRD